MASTETAIKGLEELYLSECVQIQFAAGKTLAQVEALHNNFFDQLIQQLRQKMRVLENELPSAPPPAAMNQVKNITADAVLTASQQLALELERTIEKSITEELDRLTTFVVSVDHIFQHFAHAPASSSLMQRSSHTTSFAERAPLFERMRNFRLAYSVGETFILEDSSFRTRSVYNLGILIGMLKSHELQSVVASRKEEATLLFKDKHEMLAALPQQLIEPIRLVLQTQSSERAQSLRQFVHHHFVELQHEIEAGLMEIRSLLRTHAS